MRESEHREAMGLWLPTWLDTVPLDVLAEKFTGW